MPANWSLMLNVLLLIGVVIAIARLMRARRHNAVLSTDPVLPSLGKIENRSFDDIIAVRKISQHFDEDDLLEESLGDPFTLNTEPELNPHASHEKEEASTFKENQPGKSLLIFLQAKENRKLAGYDLLQTLLAAGLRFGEGQLFHRHQFLNGQGPILCSLAAATATGVFDLQNIGAFSVRGLCLFMRSSGNSTIDAERFAVMWETAKQLNSDFDTYLLDDQQRPFNDDSINRYCRVLNIANTFSSGEERKSELLEF